MGGVPSRAGGADSRRASGANAKPLTIKDIEKQRKRQGTTDISQRSSSPLPVASLSPVATATQPNSVASSPPASHVPTAHSPTEPAGATNPFLAPLDEFREEERPYQHLASITHFDIPTLRTLHRIFTEISQSSIDDGIIDIAEMTAAMQLDQNCLLARAIFKIFDVTQTKRVNFRTWVTTLSALSPLAAPEEKIKFSFNLYDLNGDGMIDVSELRQLLVAAVKENVLTLTDSEVEAICDETLKNVDIDGNGRVDYSEYSNVVSKSRRFTDSFTLDITKVWGSFRKNRAIATAAGSASIPEATNVQLTAARMSSEEEAEKMRIWRRRKKEHPDSIATSPAVIVTVTPVTPPIINQTQ